MRSKGRAEDMGGTANSKTFENAYKSLLLLMLSKTRTYVHKRSLNGVEFPYNTSGGPVPLPNIIVSQRKGSTLGLDCFLSVLLVSGIPPTVIDQVWFHRLLSFLLAPPEFEGKILLLKTSYTWVIGHGEILSLHFCCTVQKTFQYVFLW